MRLLIIALATMFLAPAAASAQSAAALPPTALAGMPREGGGAGFPNTVYDQGGRERVTYRIDSSGGYVRGIDTDTGARWNADISATGEIKGRDIDASRWRYDPRTRLYYNLSTGRSCAATSIRRVCPS
jgi:hypothetical protein